MKCLTVVAHSACREALLDCLARNDRVAGYTLSPAEGHSRRSGEDPFETERDLVEGFSPRVRVEIIVQDEDIAGLRDALHTLHHEGRRLGVWWVTSVLNHGEF